MNAVIAIDDVNTKEAVSTIFRMCLPECTLNYSASDRQTLNMVNTINPDVIILGCLKAIEYTRKSVRDVRNRSTAPIIVISYLQNSHTIQELIDCGADRIINQPLKQLQFIASVRALLRISYKP